MGGVRNGLSCNYAGGDGGDGDVSLGVLCSVLCGGREGGTREVEEMEGRAG